MGIGVQALRLMKYLNDDGYFGGSSSVIELGSQQFAPNLPAARSALRNMFPVMDVDVIDVPRDFYRALGFRDYKCIDLDGANEALVFDLNKSLSRDYDFDETFDLVTNHGTTEHAFNQLSCFENVHNLTKQTGIIIHALPSQGYQNHSFFNYHPSFFLDLAAANDYQVLGLYYNIGEDLYPYTDSFLEEHGVLATDYVAVFAVLRKRSSKPFVIPFDGRYYFEERGHEFVPRNDVGGHSRVQHNEFSISRKHFSLSDKQNSSRCPITKIVVPVWGKEFTNIFVDFALRSQLESGLIEFDARENIEYVIVADAVSAATIRASKYFAALDAVCKVNVIRADNLVGLPSYHRLTESYNIALLQAVIGDLYIFITADCFFSREVFKKIKEKAEQYRVILSPALRVTEESFYSDVAISNLYNVDGPQALALAMRNEHPLTESFCINNAGNSMHPLPAQTLYRLKEGYVGRWNVMHPIAVRIANPHQRILQTIDWNYALSHIQSWNDVGVMDSIDDGLTVSLTPLNYSQNEKYSRGRGDSARLANLKEWVNIPWALDFHLAQICHPVRLLMTNETGSDEVVQAEDRISAITDRFVNYVNSRKFDPIQSFAMLASSKLMRPALDRPQRFRMFPRFIRAMSDKIERRILSRLRRLL